MSDLVKGMVTILTAVVGVAVLTVLVSKKNDTAGVTSAFFSGFGNILNAAQGNGSGFVGSI